MEKIKYLFGRIKNMNFKRMFSTIDEIHELSGKSKIYLFFDIINCALRYQSGYVDYLLFEMWRLNKDERKTVLTRGKNNVFVKYYNNPSYNHIFLNKNEFNEKFKKYLNREYIILNGNNKDEFNKFLKGKKVIFCKPTSGTHGDSMEKIVISEFKGDLYDYLYNKNLILVEEVVIQCEEMNKLYPYAINTVRIITVHKYEGEVLVVAAYQRIGNHGYIVDNYNGGGMVVPINEKTGIIEYPAVDKRKQIYYKHPMTDTPIVGFKVPKFSSAVNLAKKAAKVIDEIRYVGWDIAITDKGPVIIEGNEYPGHDIYQLPVHRTNNIGVLPKFEESLGKIESLKR
ncbi:MAG: sugar-transfer associated ATP-grasp domain-containing protein [Bacilli bacterium]